MWEKHCRAERAAEHARDATRKARKLLERANLPDSTASSTILDPSGPNSPTISASGQDNASNKSHQDAASISSKSSSSSSGSEDGTLREDASDDSDNISETDQGDQSGTEAGDHGRLSCSMSSRSRVSPNSPLVGRPETTVGPV